MPGGHAEGEAGGEDDGQESGCNGGDLGGGIGGRVLAPEEANKEKRDEKGRDKNEVAQAEFRRLQERNGSQKSGADSDRKKSCGGKDAGNNSRGDYDEHRAVSVFRFE